MQKTIGNGKTDLASSCMLEGSIYFKVSVQVKSGKPRSANCCFEQDAGTVEKMVQEQSSSIKGYFTSIPKPLSTALPHTATELT